MAVPTRPTSGAPIDSAWGGVVHDTAVAQDIQTGTVATNHAGVQASAQVAVVFARPFASPPKVVLGCDNFNYGAGLSAPPTTTGFTLATFRYSGVVTAGPIYTDWVAIGPRA